MRFVSLKIYNLIKAITGFPVLQGIVTQPIIKLRFVKKDGEGIEIDLSEMGNVEIYF